MELENKLTMDQILSGRNIAELLDETDLASVGSYVVNGYEQDSQSREGWEGKLDEWTKLALLVAEEKTTPWPGAANIKYPLITTAALQFSARAYPALLPGTSPVRGRVIGFDYTGEKSERAIRIGKHMSYQILSEMEDWEEEMDRLLFALPIVGCMFKKTYFSAVKGKNMSEVVYPKELVVNYWAKNIEEAERITHVLRMSQNDIYERVASEIYLDIDIDDITPPTTDDTSKGKVSDSALGATRPEEEDCTTPYTILEQCVYLDLDDDDYKEPYIVTVEESTRSVLRIVPRFMEEDVKYTAKGDILRIEPINYYTKYSFIPSPDGGFYDIGFGVLLGPINNTINTLLNQLVDSGTLSNMQSGFIARGLRIKGGNTSFTPGEWKTANSIGDDLRKGLVPLPVREPSQVLFSLLGMMIESGEKLSSVTEMMTGDIPGQNTKATVAMAAIEQGMKVFSSIYKRIHRSLGKEYRKLYTLNSYFLPDEAYFNVLDQGQEGAQPISNKDYERESIDVIPSSDPNVATEQQRLSKVEALGQLLAQGMPINPQEFVKRYLEATEQPNIEALMAVPEQGPSPEELALEWEKEKHEDEMELRWAEINTKEELTDAQIVKMYAEAEGIEEGEQLQNYAAFAKTQREDNMGLQKMRQAEQQHQMKLRQQDEAHQQKLAQQSAQGGMNEQPGATGSNP